MGYTSMAKCKALTGSAVYIKGLMCTTCAIDSKCYCCWRCFRVSCCLSWCLKMSISTSACPQRVKELQDRASSYELRRAMTRVMFAGLISSTFQRIQLTNAGLRTFTSTSRDISHYRSP